MNLLSQFIYLFLILALTWRGSHCTCVFDSDFGFKLNCAFKKSSIFRVRNLGGVKGYVGLGFSVGDELGFGQSLSNLEGNKRRSLSSANSALAAYEATSNNISKKQDRSSKNAIRSPSNLRSSTQLATVPPFKPIALEDNSTPLKPIVVPGYVVGPIDKSKKGFQVVQAPKFGGNAPVPQFAALPASISNRISSSSSVKAPMAFKNALQQATNNFQTPSTINASKLAHRTPTHSSLTDGPQVLNVVQIDRSSSSSSKVLPTAIPVSNAISDSEKPTTEKLNSNAMSETIKTLAHASNVSEDAIAAAINIRQQQLMQQQTKPKIATTTTERTTTEVIRKYPLAGPSKVMNAPKEYYPVGYDKNFDDNFVSRVELPDTSFYCGEQKHFPGLYGDEDLGCMVFHVCAFTDDGLIMKSFLCPESTLFDQSILKCNWWFYVDCKTSKKLYDSNIPISKSYQLMKALAFFSTYNKQT